MIDKEYDEEREVWLGGCEAPGCKGKVISRQITRKYCRDCTQQLHTNSTKFYARWRQKNGRKKL